jgi:hypothetical protein
MSNPFRYFNSSPEVIRLVVMMYVRYPLSLRNVENLLAERGIDISHETVRFWWNRSFPRGLERAAGCGWRTRSASADDRSSITGPQLGGAGSQTRIRYPFLVGQEVIQSRARDRTSGGSDSPFVVSGVVKCTSSSRLDWTYARPLDEFAAAI